MARKIDILRECIKRIDHYGAPADDCPIMILKGNTLYEFTLEDGSFDRQFSLGDLRDVLKEVEENDGK